MPSQRTTRRFSSEAEATYEQWGKAFRLILKTGTREHKVFEKVKLLCTGTTEPDKPMTGAQRDEAYKILYDLTRSRPTPKEHANNIKTYQMLDSVVTQIESVKAHIHATGITSRTQYRDINYGTMLNELGNAADSARIVTEELSVPYSRDPDDISRCMIAILSLEPLKPLTSQRDALALTILALKAHGLSEERLAKLRGIELLRDRAGKIRKRKERIQSEIYRQSKLTMLALARKEMPGISEQQLAKWGLSSDPRKVKRSRI